MRRICLVLSICLAAGSGRADDNDAKAEDPPVAPPPAPADTAEPPPPEAPEAPPAETQPPPPPPPVEREPTASKTGKISGVVIDAKTGEAIIEAQVTVVQTGKKVLTDIDGNYEIKLPPGSYDIRVFAELKTARRVSKINVEAGKTTKIDVQLGGDEDKIAVQEVVVTARPDTATEAVQIVRRQKAAVVQDGVSAEQISRTPDSNAGEAVKRVVSATIQDNKYVVVRGLGGRYSNTLLNGVALPSTDPDNPSAPLDLFPASLLANLTISKTFNADIPGNFAGGSLQIETREFPGRFTLKLRLSASGDSATTFTDTLVTSGGALDFLGYDDGSRALPDAVPKDAPVRLGSVTQQEANAVGKFFPRDWEANRFNAIVNPGFAGTIGDTVSMGDQRLGYLATVNYGHRWTRRDVISRTVFISGMTKEQFQTDFGRESANLGALGNLGFSITPTQRLNLVSLYTHSSDNTVQVVEGNIKTLDDQTGRRTRIDFTERSLFFNQLTGEHALGPRITLGWQGNVSVAGQEQPDLRDLLYLRGVTDTEFRFQSQPQSGERLYSDLTDIGAGGGADVTWSVLDRVKLKMGAAAQVTTRDFDARRFRLTATSSADPMTLAGSPNELFAPENIGTLFNFSEETRLDDSYKFRRTVVSGYALGDVAVLDPLRIVAGARVEAAFQRLSAGSIYTSPPSMEPPIERDDVNVLPSVNLIYSLGMGMNLRASYGLTLARPQVRELAPFRFYDVIRNRSFAGNPELKTTQIHNADLRWEWFLGATELVAVSGFFKHFIDPIETAIRSDQGDLGYINADGADTFGAELETRFSGARFHPALADLRLAGNLSIIASKINFEPGGNPFQTSTERPLQGQSPYVANVELGYRIASTVTDISLLYNVFGPRIVEVGCCGLPDVREQPFHRIDLTVTQKLDDSLVLKMSGLNLANQSVRYRQGDADVLEYKTGIAITASLEWSYDRGKD